MILCVGVWHGAARLVRYRRAGCWWDWMRWNGRTVYHQPKGAYADA